MLDIKFIRENAELVKKSINDKNIKLNLDDLLLLDNKRRGILGELDKLNSQKNEIANKSKGGIPTQEDIENGKKIKNEISALNEELKKIDNNYVELLFQVPNITSNDTPVGKDESENKILRICGDIPKFDFKALDHMDLGELHGIIDTEKSAKISGSRFNYLFKEAVLIQFALLQFCFDVLTNKNIISNIAKKTNNPFDKPFIPVITPVIAKTEIMKKMDRFDPIEDRYYLEKDDSLLIGSTEHTLGPLHMNEIISEKDLPIRYVGYSSAFRREAGSYGKDVSGILRRHQFEQSEIETFVQPEYGLVEQEFIVAVQEYLMSQLKLPYQLVLKCTGDMGGKADFRAMDIECWMPGQNKYRETHTSDYMTDFQARRLNTRYRKSDGSIEFVHMNDATGFAMGRILIGIIENYQQADGSILIPEVLHKYMSEAKIEVKK